MADGLVRLGAALGIGYAGLYGAVYLATFLISNIVRKTLFLFYSFIIK